MTEPEECAGCCKNVPGAHCPLPPEQCACRPRGCSCCQCEYCMRVALPNVHVVCIAHHDTCQCGRHDHSNACPCISCMLIALRAQYAPTQRATHPREDDRSDDRH